MPSPALCSIEKTHLLHQGLMSLQRAVLNSGLTVCAHTQTHKQARRNTHVKLLRWQLGLKVKPFAHFKDVFFYHPPVALEITTPLETRS